MCAVGQRVLLTITGPGPSFHIAPAMALLLYSSIFQKSMDSPTFGRIISLMSVYQIWHIFFGYLFPR